ncbi:MAG: AraC family transcriptional regulator [Clostridia bacterium]|nr:AraC family transcriptional regulator [Clostridia bacterium]MBQ8405054.1 AraC family transcriptional regulator [Clostridia bacterium]
MKNKKLQYHYRSGKGEDHIIEAEPLYSEVRVQAIQSLYQYRLAPDFKHPGESHDLHEFFYVMQGKMKVITRNGTFYLNAGDFIIVPPNLFHTMWPNKDFSFSVSICFKGEGLEDNLITMKIGKLNNAEKYCLNQIVKTYAENRLGEPNSVFPTTDEPKNDYAFRQIIKNELENLLILITRDFQLSLTAQNETLTQSSADIAMKTKAYIDEHFKEKLLLDDIAKELGYSVGHICRVFKKRQGLSIVNYILKRRIQEAMLLLNKGKSLQSVSDELGFDSIQYFCKIFKRIVNITPKQYKQRSMQDHYISYDYFLSVMP